MPLALSVGAAALALLALAAFWPMYLSKPPSAVDGYTHLHAGLGACWMLLLVTQPLALRCGWRAWHRAAGRAGIVVAAAFSGSGVLLAHHRFSRMDAAAFAREAPTLYLPLAVVLLFTLAWALALRQRRQPALHARYMAATALLLIDPVLGRVLFFHGPPLPSLLQPPAPTFALTALLLAALWHSLPAAMHGRSGFAAYALGAVVVLGGWWVWPDTSAWTGFASWFRSLPLT